jgi:tripartite ATP-independent transporter DctP family solute receptor
MSGKSILKVLAAAAVIWGLSVPSASALEFKFAHSGSLEHQYHIGAEYFKKLVEEKSGGEIKVNIFPQAQLGSEREEAEGVRMGTIEVTAIAAGGALPGFVPEMQVLGVPYLFKSRAQAYKALDGEVGAELNRCMEAKGFRNLAYWEVGFRNFTNGIRPIKTPADMKDLKIRVQESKIWMEFISRLGGIPTPIPFSELYSALQQKVVDGEENPVATIYSMKYYEVQKYLSLDRHTYEAAAVLANPKWFAGLTPDQQTIILEAAAETSDYQRKFLEDQEVQQLDVIRKAGVEILENPDIDAFAEATKDLYKVLGDVIPESLIEKIRAGS